MSKIASFQFPLHNSPTHWLPPFKLCDVFGSNHAPGRKLPIKPEELCMVPTVQHHAQSAPPGNGVPLLATFAAFFFPRRPRGTPAGAAETHAPAAPASAPFWAAALRGCAAQPRVLLRPQQTTAECATAGATSTTATGRRRVAGCDVHVSHSCAGAQAPRSHVHESLICSYFHFIE